MAEKRLRATEFMDGMDFTKHIEDLREKWKSATKKKAVIDDAAFWNILIASLPESWNTVVAGVTHNPLGSTRAPKAESRSVSNGPSGTDRPNQTKTGLHKSKLS
ncbi:hypothetical protein C0995_010574 [Termitomyces sp. Mi166|nr:hypothetical protein C0995_010574 [Termitomyces sp. Mi166\